jgi:hypothetical protein
MKRLLLICGAVGLALPALVLAKGPSGATIQGPGIRTLTITGNGEHGSASRLGRLTMAAGLFPAVFGQTPDPMLRTRRKGTLGRAYTIVWRVPGPEGAVSRIKQLAYPYAKPAPLTYMRPGQLFWESNRTYGGWFHADPSLRRLLGLPLRPVSGS